MKRPDKKHQVLVILVLTAALLGISAHYLSINLPQQHHDEVATAKTKTQRTSVKKAVTPQKKQATIDWRAPSETKPYPDLKQHSHVTLEVAQGKQRVYVKDGKTTLYTMYVSTGIKHTTPNGKFAIQAERGKSFYNKKLKEGANYWTSWSGHGVYLFHSVPTTAKGHYKAKEAEKLGTKASHGCVRLTIPDAKWINQHIPYGTKVIVHDP